jgi:hypothetical protein
MKRYDAFLSYTSEDQPVAMAVAKGWHNSHGHGTHGVGHAYSLIAPKLGRLAR